MPPVVKNLLIINIIFFIATLLFKHLPLNYWLGVTYFDAPTFRIWQVITYMFMHGGFSHIFFNMFALITFGSPLEQVMGSKRFFNYYFLTGIGALALQFAVQAYEVYQITGSPINPGAVTMSDLVVGSGSVHLENLTGPQATALFNAYETPMVGASGAIFGLLIAFGMLFPDLELMLIFLPIPIKAKYFIPIYIILELFLGVQKFAGDSVAHFAHLGGALFGFLLVKLWQLRRPGGYR